MNTTKWERVSPDKPCRVCGEGFGCGASHDGSIAICNRVKSNTRAKQTGWMHYLTADGSRIDLDNLRARVAIADVIKRYIDIRPKGREMVGLCPFHDDSDPSLTISTEKNFYKCFACGAGGDAFKFVMDYDGCSFPAAVQRVADSAPAAVDAAVVRRKAGQKVEAEKSSIDCVELQTDFRLAVARKDVGAHAGSLGVSTDSLRRLDIGWHAEYGAWTFPMRGRREDFDEGDKKGRDFSSKIIGFRIRAEDGAKWAQTGSKSGLFIPADIRCAGSYAQRGPLLIAEGPTDTAACLSLGFDAVGRPSCMGQEDAVVEALKWIRPPIVGIMADPDGPGQKGAELLASILHENEFPTKLVYPPRSADVRAWVKEGATRESITMVLDNADLWRPEAA